jgi:hypothetical protein
VAREDPQLLPRLGPGRLPTSLDLLAPGEPALEHLANRFPPGGVHYHSIIGEAFGSGATGSDGVVPYTSAHLDGVDTEIVIPASHLGLQHHPRAVLELWRILLEHLREVKGPTGLPPLPPLLELPGRTPQPGQETGPKVVRR